LGCLLAAEKRTKTEDQKCNAKTMEVQQISANVSSSGIYFYIYCANYCSVFVPGRSRVVQTHVFSFCTARDRPGTNTETIIRTINVKGNPRRFVRCPYFFPQDCMPCRLSVGAGLFTNHILIGRKNT
jgi:hypothetical protein